MPGLEILIGRDLAGMLSPGCLRCYHVAGEHEGERHGLGRHGEELVDPVSADPAARFRVAGQVLDLRADEPKGACRTRQLAHGGCRARTFVHPDARGGQCLDGGFHPGGGTARGCAGERGPGGPGRRIGSGSRPTSRSGRRSCSRSLRRRPPAGEAGEPSSCSWTSSDVSPGMAIGRGLRSIRRVAPRHADDATRRETGLASGDSL